MKKSLFMVLFLVLLLFSVEGNAETPRTTLQYYSPQSGNTISGEAVTFEWNIHSWDTVKQVVISINGPGKNFEKIVFKGNEAKRRKHTVTGLQKNSTYIWSIWVETTKESGSFGKFPGYLFFTE